MYPTRPFQIDETRRGKNPGVQRGGFTMIELLIVIAVLGIMAAIGGLVLPGLNQKFTLESAAQRLSQDIQILRSRATTTDNSWRVHITGANTYKLEYLNNAGVWTQNDAEAILPSNMTLSNTPAGDTLTASTQGMLTLNLHGAVPGEVRLTDGTRTIRLIPTLVGAVKVIK